MYLDIISPKEINIPGIFETTETISETINEASEIVNETVEKANSIKDWGISLFQNTSGLLMIALFLVLAVAVVVFTKNIIKRELKNVKEV